MFAFIDIETYERLAIPIAIAIALLVIFLVPPVRKSMLDAFKKGQQHGKKLSGKDEADED